LGGPLDGYGDCFVHHNTIAGSYGYGNLARNITLGISFSMSSANFDSYIIEDNIFYRAKWYAFYQETAVIAGGPAIINNNLFYDNYFYYWSNPAYQYTYQWNGTVVTNGTAADLSILVNVYFTNY
jgi:hypothetical protein